MENTSPEDFEYEQSTSQGFYFFNKVLVNGLQIDSNDWVGAFKGDVCVGARQWGECDDSEGCDIPAMGIDGSEYTVGYMMQGDVPTFRIYDSSEDIYYDAISDIEACVWSPTIICSLDQLAYCGPNNDCEYDCAGIWSGVAENCPDWDFDNNSQFAENMSVTAKVYNNGVDIGDEGDILATFVGLGLRGIALSTDVSDPGLPGDGHIFLTTIHSNETINYSEILTFQFYDLSEDAVLNINENLSFGMNLSLGDAIAPQIFTIKNTLDISQEIINKYDIINTYPNPFNANINIEVNLEENNYLNITIIDVNGNEIEDIFKGYQLKGKYYYYWNAKNYPTGIYFVNINKGNKHVLMQKITLLK